MALPKKTIPFVRGLNSKTDEKMLEEGQLSVLENAIFSEAVTLKKRNGTEKLSSQDEDGVDITPRALVVRGDELLSAEQEELYSWDSSAGVWSLRGTVEAMKVRQRTVAYRNTEQSNPDLAFNDSITVYCWEDASGGVWASVESTASESLLVPPRQISVTGSRIRAVKTNAFILLVWAETADNELRSLFISDSDAATSIAAASTIVTSDLDDENPNFDVAPYGNTAIIAWNIDGSDGQKVGYLTASGDLGSPGSGFATAVSSTDESSSGGIAITSAPDGDIGVVFTDGTDVHSKVYTASLGTVASGVAYSGSDVRNVACAFRNEVENELYPLYFYFEEAADESYNHYVGWDHLTASGTDWHVDVNDSVTYLRHSGLATRAFTQGDFTYANVVYDTVNQPTLFTVRDDETIVAKGLPTESVGLRTTPSLSSVYANGNKQEFAAGFRFRLPVEAGNPNSYAERSIKRITLDFDPDDDFRSVEMGESIYSTGGYLWTYDGRSPYESGFHLPTENIVATPATSGTGALTADATYTYHFYWEDYSTAGEREISTTVSGVTVELSGSEDAVDFTIPTLAHTQRRSDLRNAPRLAAYRNIQDESGLPTLERYRVDDPTDPTFNDPTVDTIVFSDQLSDAEVGLREVDHEVAEFEHVAPPAASVIAQSEDRVFLAGFENPDQLMFSKLQEYTKGVAFSDLLTLEVPPEGGPITGMAPLDGRVIIFKENRIYQLVGPGPSNTGVDTSRTVLGEFQPPQLITTNVGCSNQRSIVECPKGILFQSSKGIYLLNRESGVEYVGAPVEAFNDQTVKSAVSVPTTNHVVFVMSSGSTLLWDYHDYSTISAELDPVENRFGRWSSWTNYIGKDAVIWQDTLVRIGDDGDVHQEVDGVYTDSGQRYKLRFRTGWITLDGSPQGYVMIGQLWVLGEFRTGHHLKVRVSYDFQEKVFEYDWDPPFSVQKYGEDTIFGDEDFYGVGGTYGGAAAATAYDLEIGLWERAKAVRIEIFDDTTQGTDTPGEAYEVNVLALRLIDQNSVPQHPTTNKLG